MNSKEIRAKFNFLSVEDKAGLLCARSIWLMMVDTPDGKYSIGIYSLDTEFIETFYNKHTKEVEQIWMPSYEEMDAYMRVVSIKSLNVKTT